MFRRSSQHSLLIAIVILLPLMGGVIAENAVGPFVYPLPECPRKEFDLETYSRNVSSYHNEVFEIGLRRSGLWFWGAPLGGIVGVAIVLTLYLKTGCTVPGATWRGGALAITWLTLVVGIVWAVGKAREEIHRARARGAMRSISNPLLDIHGAEEELPTSPEGDSEQSLNGIGDASRPSGEPTESWLIPILPRLDTERSAEPPNAQHVPVVDGGHATKDAPCPKDADGHTEGRPELAGGNAKWIDSQIDVETWKALATRPDPSERSLPDGPGDTQPMQHE